jgi:capsular exopolysaccharide synthesis family protein
MITSALRAEGKSTTAANLSVALARAGHRVTLVDLDLRLPTIHKLFDLDQDVGLAHVVLGRARLDEALVKIPILDEEVPSSSSNGSGGRLQVLPTGPLPPNPAEFVDSQALGNILTDLQWQSDIVIVDSPPLLALSDTVKLTRKVDAVVVVARLSLIRRATLEELRRVLEGAPTAKLGTVVTGATAQDGYGYGYGYAYGYGRRGSRREEKEAVR